MSMFLRCVSFDFHWYGNKLKPEQTVKRECLQRVWLHDSFWEYLGHTPLCASTRSKPYLCSAQLLVCLLVRDNHHQTAGKNTTDSTKQKDRWNVKDPILVISFHLHFGYFSMLAVLLQYTDSEYQIKPHIWYCVSGFVCTGPPAPCGRGFTT